MSEVQMIGKALFGESWMSQTAVNLSIKVGRVVSRQTIQSWHNRGNLPAWARIELLTLTQERYAEIEAMRIKLDYMFALQRLLQRAIEVFFNDHGSELTPNSTIYFRLSWGCIEYDYVTHKIDLTLDKPKDPEGWYEFSFDPDFFQNDILCLKDRIYKKILINCNGIYDSSLDKKGHA